jgi:hypothetical protein
LIASYFQIRQIKSTPLGYEGTAIFRSSFQKDLLSDMLFKPFPNQLSFKIGSDMKKEQARQFPGAIHVEFVGIRTDPHHLFCFAARFWPCGTGVCRNGSTAPDQSGHMF